MRNRAFHGTTSLSRETPTQQQILERLYKDIRDRLPDSWKLERTQTTRRPEGQADAILCITDQSGTQGRIVIEVKRQIDPIDVPHVLDLLRRYASPGDGTLVIAPFLGSRTRALLTAQRVGYADATGNMRLQLDQPAIYIETMGAERNPWNETRPLHSLRGPAAGRIVRALCDFRPPYALRALAELANTPPSSASRVVGLLERDALVVRGPHGEITDAKWPEILRRWAGDYGLTTSNRTQVFLEPRGLDALLRRLSATEILYAVTGSLAAVRKAPIAPPRLATIYVAEIDLAAEKLGLRRTERGPNVLLAEPFDPVVFARSTREEGITYAALSQVGPDLLTGPGRGPQEGEELLKWMEEHEDAWRR